MMRQLMLQPTLVSWLDECTDGNLNLGPLKDNLLSSTEVKDIQALCYVLLHIRPFDSIAQATSQASGVKYARLINTTIQRLTDLSKDTPSEEVQQFDNGKR